jgi:hypothetical protein
MSWQLQAISIPGSGSTTGGHGSFLYGGFDIDADGFGDIVVINYENIYFIYGSSDRSLFSSSEETMASSSYLKVAAPGPQYINDDSEYIFSYPMAGSADAIGDFDGDGYGDIAIKLFQNSTGDHSAATLVVYGDLERRTGELSFVDFYATGPESFFDSVDFATNATIAGEGDVNGDGHPDIVSYGGGGVFVVRFGSGSRLGAPSDAFDFYSRYPFEQKSVFKHIVRDETGQVVNDWLSSYWSEERSGDVDLLGNIDGDALDDMIFWSPTFIIDSDRREATDLFFPVFFVPGSAFTPGASRDVEVVGTEIYRTNSSESLFIEAIGDFNGDGFHDAAVSDAERTMIYLGLGATGSSPFAAAITLQHGGGEIMALGDFNGDGRDDFALAAGIVFGADLMPGAELDLDEHLVSHGVSAAVTALQPAGAAGDLDGDGYADVLMRRGGEDFILFGGLSADAGSVPPVLSGDFAIEVEAGGAVALLPEDISIVVGAGAAGATFMVLATTAGHVALADDPETPVEQFTRRDIEAGRVLFVHDGSAGATAGFTVEAIGSAGLGSGQVAVTASVTPGEGGGGAGFPIVVDDKVFAIEDNPRTVLASVLLANDLSTVPGDLVIEAVYGALNGAVALDADGNVVFTPAADFAGIGGFGYRVVDSFGDAAEGLVEVEIIAEDDAPRATDADFGSVRADVRVAGLVTTTPSLPTDIAVSTLATDPDSALGPQSFAFVGASIDGAAATLTQAGVTYDAATGAFAFDPTGVAAFRALRSDESASVVVRFTVSDGALADQGTARFTVLGTNAAPVLSGDFALMMREGGAVALTTDDLSGTDAESGPDGLTFTVANAINGAVLLNGAATSRFTQADLDAGRVAFAHDGSETDAASFDVILTDGEGASLPAQTVSAAVALAPDNTILARVGGTGTTDAPPQFEILADGASLGVFAIAQPVVRAPVDFEYFLVESDGAAPDTVTVRFLNDGWPGGVDRNLWVDYIEVNGARLEAETEGAYVLKNGLFVGARERLFTNGDLVFANLRDDPETDATTVVVRAGGTGTDAAPAQFRVTIDGADFGIFAVTNPAATNRDFVYDSFVFEIAAPSVSRVEIAFINDGRSDGIDRNLWVDYVAVNDVTHHAEIEGVYIRDNGADLGARQSMYWNGTLTFDDLWG